MKELIASVDAGLFWGVVVGFVLGVVTSWRFARIFERFRDAVWQTKSHFRKALEFYRFASEHLTLLVSAGVLGVVVSAGVGFLVYLRVTG